MARTEKTFITKTSLPNFPKSILVTSQPTPLGKRPIRAFGLHKAMPSFVPTRWARASPPVSWIPCPERLPTPLSR
ncbi:hypothetical protein VTK26DRAFT_7206 [Humicola hyalothermophila]